MRIRTENLGKKFRNEWIFRNANLELHAGESYTFTGSNGSGKSTILQVIAGFVPLSEGKILYETEDGGKIEIERFYKYLSLAAPYLELIEEFTLTELVDFHQQFKPFFAGLGTAELIDFIELPQAKNKAIKHFSSGMKQRVKLGLAFLSDTPILMLDEPTSNLDAQATAWYLKNVQQYKNNRLTLICSNQPNEYEFCQNIFSIHDFKPKK